MTSTRPTADGIASLFCHVCVKRHQRSNGVSVGVLFDLRVFPNSPDQTRKVLERVKGIEPSYAAWEAAVLPLNYTRASLEVPRGTGGVNCRNGAVCFGRGDAIWFTDQSRRSGPGSRNWWAGVTGPVRVLRLPLENSCPMKVSGVVSPGRVNPATTSVEKPNGR